MLSTPGASSSRVTLDDLDAVDRLAKRASSLARQRPSRAGLSRRGRRAAALALSLCIPSITAADARPSPISRDTPARDASSAWSRLASLTVRSLDASGLIDSQYASPSTSWAMPANFVILRQRFSPGFIILSYCIAFVGSLCTLELLIRRTSNAGWRNQLLLASAGICFGAVSTFSMHFIFNQALTLHHPDIQDNDSLALIYAPGFTVLSLVASCAAMTIAFFVMGTDLGNWCCVFGANRKHRTNKREKENQRQADEYKKWKMAHMRKGELLSRGGKSMGALVAAAGRVAKWSLVEDPHRGDQSPPGGWLAGKLKGKDVDAEDTVSGAHDSEGFVPSVEEDMIARDKKLREIDFRQGRTATRLEIARRGEQAMHAAGRAVTPTSASLSGRPSVEQHPHPRNLASTASLPAIPPVAAYPPRRGSVPAHFAGHSTDFSSSSTEVFTPGYNFPPRIDSSTANLLRRDSAPGSPNESESSPSWPRRGSMDIPPHVPFDYSSRRASLPNTSAPPLRDAIFSTTLSRIQSLPEADQDHPGGSVSHSPGMPRSAPSFSQAIMTTPHLEEGFGTDKLGEHDQDVSFAPEGQGEGRMKRAAARAKRWEGSTWSLKIQRFLGFDVVTKEEIIKIVLTGTIAGCGVAAMRELPSPAPLRGCKG